MNKNIIKGIIYSIFFVFFTYTNTVVYAVSPTISIDGKKTLSDGKSTQTINGNYGSTGIVGMTIAQQVATNKGKASCSYMTSVFSKLPLYTSTYYNGSTTLSQCNELDIDGDGNIEVLYTTKQRVIQGWRSDVSTYFTYLIAPTSPNLILTNGTYQRMTGSYEIKNILGKDKIYIYNGNSYINFLEYDNITKGLKSTPFVYDHNITPITVGSSYLLAQKTQTIRIPNIYDSNGGARNISIEYYIFDLNYNLVLYLGKSNNYIDWNAIYKGFKYYKDVELGGFGSTITSKLGYSDWLLIKGTNNNSNNTIITLADLKKKTNITLATGPSNKITKVHRWWYDWWVSYFNTISIIPTGDNTLLLYSTNSTSGDSTTWYFTNWTMGGVISLNADTYNGYSMASQILVDTVTDTVNSVINLSQSILLNTGGSSFVYYKNTKQLYKIPLNRIITYAVYQRADKNVTEIANPIDGREKSWLYHIKDTITLTPTAYTITRTYYTITSNNVYVGRANGGYKRVYTNVPVPGLTKIAKWGITNGRISSYSRSGYMKPVRNPIRVSVPGWAKRYYSEIINGWEPALSLSF